MNEHTPATFASDFSWLLSVFRHLFGHLNRFAVSGSLQRFAGVTRSGVIFMSVGVMVVSAPCFK